MTLSVIIPCLEEEKYIESCLSALRNKSATDIEIILVDAGSEDSTVSIARKMFVDKIIEDKELRGKKYMSLNKGASMADGDILLFLDADTIVPDNFDKMIFKALDESYVGGAFELRFDKDFFFLNIVRVVNAFRYRLTKNFFGDQGIFCKKEVFNELGGFPQVPILEAKYLCRRLRRKGKLKLIREPVISSSRRFVSGGIMRTFISDVHIYLSDILGAENNISAEKYWKQIDR